MKAKDLNNSSKKTKDSIKNAYIDFLLNSNKNVNKITVSDVVKKANINRSTFYLHYDCINDVATEIEEEIIEEIIGDFKFVTIDEYIDKMTVYLKKNERFYSRLAHSNYYQLFSNKIRNCYEEILVKIVNDKYTNTDKKYLNFVVNFLIDAIFSQFRNYFLMDGYPYTLDEINMNLKKVTKAYLKI